jgi:hypothetical protein
MSARPPSLAAWLVSRVTPEADREPLLGDLEEEYQRLRAAEGAARARSFYWMEALRAVGPGLRRRFRRDPAPEGPLAATGGSMLDGVWFDLKVAARTLLRHPRLSATVALTIAVGIAASTAVFAVVDGVVLRPFPFPEPGRLVTVGTVIPKLNQELSFFENLSPAEYLDIARECRSLQDVVAWDMGNRQVAQAGPPENLFSSFFWGDAFPTLGVAPAVGRGFTDDEIRRGEKVAIVSHRYWSSRLGGDPAAVGKRVLVNGEPYALVGVMAPGTLVYGTGIVSDARNRGLDRAAEPELFVNLQQSPEVANQYFVLVRTRVEPLSLVPALRARVAALDPEQPIYAVQTVRQALDAQGLPRRVASSLLLVLTGVALVLAGTGIFAVVSHVAASRTREIGLRLALGATTRQVRGLVVRQALGPAALGGSVGLVAAVALASGLRGLFFGVTPFDPLTLAAVVVLLVALVVLASDGPARRAARLEAVSALRAE